MLKDDIQKLSRSIFVLAKRDESNILSYWSGYFENRRDREKNLTKLIGSFLKTEYRIEEKLTTWIEQIDHYSFIKEVGWFEGFYKLLAEIENYEGEEITDVEQEKYFNFTKVVNQIEILDEFVTEKGIKVRKGNILRLSDKIGNDYKKTKYFDINIKNPSWELFYPSDNDFKFIRFMHKREEAKMNKITFGFVWRIFSNFPTTVQSIETRNEKIYINTDIFEIELENALIANEFSISSEESIPDNFRFIIEGLNSHIENFRLGLLTEDEINLSQFISDNFFRFNLDWQNYRRNFASNIGRHWCKLEK